MLALEVKRLFWSCDRKEAARRLKEAGIPRHKRRQLQRAVQKNRLHLIPVILGEGVKHEVA